tara:strand:- start:580 stop:786 length:207 start_codon:yes stop_codon:yes gene_type:complete
MSKYKFVVGISYGKGKEGATFERIVHAESPSGALSSHARFVMADAVTFSLAGEKVPVRFELAYEELPE